MTQALALLVLTFFSQSIFSIDVQFNKFTQNLAYESLENAILENPQTLKRNRWGFSAGYSFVEDPLSRGSKNTNLTSILSQLHSLQIGFNFAISERFELMFGSAVHHATNNILVESNTVLGDSFIALKYQLLKAKKFAIAVTPHFIVPTGDSDKFLGGENPGYGATVSVEKKFKHFGSVLNIGYTKTPENIVQNIDYEDVYSLGVGVRVPIKKLAIQAEYRVNYTNKSSEQRPNELHLGASYQLNDEMRGFLSVGLGNTELENNNDYRFLGGVKGSFGDREEIMTSSIVNHVREQLKISKEIHFKFASFKIEPFLYTLLDEIARIIKTNEQFIRRIEIHGHTDTNGTQLRNQRLSFNRAYSVARYLVRAGVKPDFLIPRGFGEERLKKSPEITKYDAFVNRRVEFDVFELE